MKLWLSVVQPVAWLPTEPSRRPLKVGLVVVRQCLLSGIFICDIYDDTVHVSDCVEWATSKWLTGKNVEWSVQSLTWNYITVLACKDWIKPQRPESGQPIPGPILKSGPPEYNAGVLSNISRCTCIIIRYKTALFHWLRYILQVRDACYGRSSGCGRRRRPYMEGSCDSCIKPCHGSGD
jgi:hypothetical protein